MFKKMILTVLTAFTICTGAQAEEECVPFYAESVCFGSFNYIKIGGSSLPKGSGVAVGPSIGIGRRFTDGCKAIDLSLNWAGSGHEYYFAIPKIMYLQYFTPEVASSFYAGGGLSYGFVRNAEKDRRFEGVFAELALGYEWHRNSDIRVFTELTLSQSILALSTEHRLSAPVFALAFGIGF